MGSMSCNNICERSEQKKIPSIISKYKLGLKYCTICQSWFKDYKRCPCCNNLLRVRSRSNKPEKSKQYMKIWRKMELEK